MKKQQIFQIFGVPLEQKFKSIIIDTNDSIHNTIINVCQNYKMLYSPNFILVYKDVVLEENSKINRYDIDPQIPLNLLDKRNIEQYLIEYKDMK